MAGITKACKILLLCNSEHGQSNIFLAIAYELLRLPDVDIHLCSFPVLEKRFKCLLADHVGDDLALKPGAQANFHSLDGPTMTDVFLRTGHRGAFHAPGLGVVDGFAAMCDNMWSWTEDEYSQIYQSCVNVITEVDPSLVLVDFFFLQGRDAVVNLERRYCIVNTTSLSHIVSILQPTAAWAWKYPVSGSGFPYPLPLPVVPINAWVATRCASVYRTSSGKLQLKAYRARNDIKGRMPFTDPWQPNRFHLSPSLPELDWKMHIPDNVIGCGPILMPTKPLQESDPEMYTWLQRKPTILINLGTLVASESSDVEEIARAVKDFLATNDMQVLWKLATHPKDGHDPFRGALRHVDELQSSRSVKIVHWLESEPLALLRTGLIACSIHHGGANSWFEAIKLGVPHIVLPPWLDCYDNAVRAEWLGVGVYGNKSTAPHINAKELLSAMKHVIENDTFSTKAKQLRHQLSTSEGRQIAAEMARDIATGVRKPCVTSSQESAETKSQGSQSLVTISNVNGKTLVTTQYNEIRHSWLYRLVQDACIVADSTFVWWTATAVFLLLIPYFRVFWIVYNIWVLYFNQFSEEVGLPWWYRWIRASTVWRWYTKMHVDYYPIRLYRSEPLLEQRKYVIGYHPHGVFIRGLFACFGLQTAGFSELFPGLGSTFHIDSKKFSRPLTHDYALLAGCKSASKACCVRHLTTGGKDGHGGGHCVVLAVGGGREFLIARPNSMDVVVNIRKGFVRLAVETGADLVPVVGFGENDIWDRTRVHPFFRPLLQVLYWTFDVKISKWYKGRWSILCPYKIPINVVVGRPIRVIQQTNPDPEYVHDLHNKYVQGLRELWDDWRDHFGMEPSVEFKIVK